MPTSIRLDAAIERRLDVLAQETGRTKAFYLREIIARGIEDMEDYYRAEQVMQRIRKGEEPVYTIEEVSRRLELDN
jgi:RHH-type transcriptional regulator, rel operon repressor / antitoxin RelB